MKGEADKQSNDKRMPKKGERQANALGKIIV